MYPDLRSRRIARRKNIDNGMNITTSPDRMSILVVEDETLLAMNLETILTDLGHAVVGPYLTLRELDAALDAGLQADAAILDINIAGEHIFPHARRLAALGIPLLFATGYGESGLTDDLAGRPVVQKPYTEHDIAGVLDTLRSV